MPKEMQSFIHKQIAMLDKDESYSRAACAKLRQAAGKPRSQTPGVWDITLQNAPEDSLQSDVIHTILTLYALHRQGKDTTMNDNSTGFGTAIASLVTPENEEAIRRRFNAVATAQEFAELTHHARGLIQLLKAKDKKLNYSQFAKDLYDFKRYNVGDKIRLQWGEQFYRTNTTEGKDEK